MLSLLASKKTITTKNTQDIQVSMITQPQVPPVKEEEHKRPTRHSHPDTVEDTLQF